jgi:DNA-binding transcriptional regulator YdaS (Cro superfamily)
MENAKLTPKQYIAYEYGTLGAFAKAVGVTKTSVSLWLKNGFPVGKLKTIEEKTNGRIKAKFLRPELFTN